MGDGHVRQTFLFFDHSLYVDYVKVYTDGSKQDSGSVGSAIFIDDLSTTFSWKLDSQHSVLTFELYAIYQGILFVHDILKNQNVVIFINLLSALKMLKHPNRN